MNARISAALAALSSSLVLLALASCRSGDAPREPEQAAAALEQRPVRATFEPATPESVGIAPEALERLRAGVREIVDEDGAVGAEVLILKNRKLVLHEAFGWKDREDQVALAPDTIFCVRSMTKPFVGTAVQMLIDEGKLTLEDRASRYLPSFDNERSGAITIEQLLTHTAGFPMTLVDRAIGEYSGQREVADQAGAIGPTYPPGSRFSYSDCDSEALAAIVSVVTGEAPERFIQRRILDPLGMRDTFAVLAPGAPDRARVASNYLGQPGKWTKYFDDEGPPFFPYFFGAASMYSTELDYARFLALWMDGGVANGQRLLSAAAVERALTPAVPMLVVGGDSPYPSMFTGVRVFYGQHWMVWVDEAHANDARRNPFGHGGSDGTFAYAFPEQDLMAFYFTQSRGGLSGFRFEELLAPLVGFETVPEPPPSSSPPSPDELSSLVGTYRFVENETYVVTSLERGRLQVAFIGLTSGAPKDPDADGWWRFAAPSKARLRFERGATGAVEAMQLDDGGTQVSLARIEPDAALPTLDELQELRRHGQGGDAFDRLRTLHMSGELELKQTKGTVDIWMDGPTRFSSKTALGRNVQTAVAVDGRAWSLVPGQNPQELEDALREQVVLTNPLARMGDWRATHEKVEILERLAIHGVETYVVLTRPAVAPPSVKFVDASTGRIVHEESWSAVPGIGMIPAHVDFEDYREVDGVWLPFVVARENQLTGKLVAHYTEVEVNPELPADVFAHEARSGD